MPSDTCPGSSQPVVYHNGYPKRTSYDPGKGNRNRYGDLEGECATCHRKVRTFAAGSTVHARTHNVN